MTTVLQIVNGAAEEIGVKTAEIPLEAGDYQVILDRMNDMLIEWADKGLTPQFVEVFNSTDVVAVARSSVSAVKYNLAIRIAPAFEKVITAALAANARETMANLETSIVYIGEVAYPDTLPTGSGNDCDYDRRFYPNNEKVLF
jgi:hypothetical protein